MADRSVSIIYENGLALCGVCRAVLELQGRYYSANPQPHDAIECLPGLVARITELEETLESKSEIIDQIIIDLKRMRVFGSPRAAYDLPDEFKGVLS